MPTRDGTTIKKRACVQEREQERGNPRCRIELFPTSVKYEYISSFLVIDMQESILFTTACATLRARACSALARNVVRAVVKKTTFLIRKCYWPLRLITFSN